MTEKKGNTRKVSGWRFVQVWCSKHGEVERCICSKCALERCRFDKVTRLEVIGDKREYVKWNCRIEPHWQDNEKTLKIFVYSKKVK